MRRAVRPATIDPLAAVAAATVRATDPPNEGAAVAVQPYSEAPASTDLAFGLHHVQLAVPPGGEDEARAFYVTVLGMTEVAKPPVLAARGGLWVRADHLEIHLGVEDGFAPQRKAHPGILADLDVLAARLDGHDWPYEWDDNFPGMRRFYTADSHGNRLEFLQPKPH